MAADKREATSAQEWDRHTEALLRDWHQRVTAARTGHYLLASRCRRRNVLLGVPVVVCSTLVGTSLFATLNNETVDSTLRLVIGGISVLAAMLAALQTFLRFGERAEKHVIAADWYSAVRRDIAEILALPAGSREKPKECLDRLRKEMSKIGQQSPEIGERVWAGLQATYNVDDSAPLRSGDNDSSEAVRRRSSGASESSMPDPDHGTSSN